MTITSQVSIASLLTEPTSSTDSFMWEVRQRAGIVVAVVDWGLKKLIDFSPLEEWIVKPFGGGWEDLDKGGQAWDNVGSAITAMSKDLDSLAGQIGTRWQGQARDAFDQMTQRTTQSLNQLPVGAAALAEASRAIAEASKAAANLAADFLKQLCDLALEILTLLASVFTAPLAAKPLAELAAKLPMWVQRIAQAIQKVMQIIELLQKLAGPIRTLASDISTITNGLKQGGSSVTSQISAANSILSLAV